MRTKTLLKTAILAKTSRVDHRDGAGHLNPAYAASLYERASLRAENSIGRAFVSRPWSADSAAEGSGEEFVRTVTSGEDGGEDELDDVTLEERGGPFVETSGATEFAYGTDASNPVGATREPFPTSRRVR